MADAAGEATLGHVKQIVAEQARTPDVMSPSPLERVRAVPIASPAGALGLVFVGVWLAWAWLDGALTREDWTVLAALLPLTLLLAIATHGVPGLLGGGFATRLVVGSSIGLVAWSFLSMIWADLPGDALIGSDRLLIYVIGLLAFVLFPPSARTGILVLAAYGFGVAVTGAVVIARAAVTSDLTALFQRDRLAAPTDYVNSTAAFWMLGFFICLFLASSPSIHRYIRPAALASAGLLFQLALLGQSRGWLIATPIAVAIGFAVARDRLRLAVALALVLLATAAVALPVLDVARGGGELDPEIERAAIFIGLSFAALVAAGFAWMALEPRLAGRRRPRLLLPVALVAIALVIGAATVGSIESTGARHWVTDRWDEFAHGGTQADSDDLTRFGSLETNRLAEWRVSWNLFREEPVHGIGSENFANAYLRDRQTYHDARYPLSTPLGMLAELGAVGLALFIVIIASALTLALRMRRRSGDTALVVAAALTAFTYWLLHASVDWFWPIMAITAPAIGLLGLAAAVGRERRVAPRPLRFGSARLTSIVVAGPVLAVAAAALAIPWLAAGYQQSASRMWRESPETAYARLERAASLDRLRAEPYVVEASIALVLRDASKTRQALARALEREPDNWYAYLQLGLLEGYLGNYGAAERAIERAQELNPQDSIIGHALRVVQKRQEVNPDDVNSLYLRRLNARLGTNAYPEDVRRPFTPSDG
jgi:tetratricopeptide (TPR) repeat protein